MGRMTTWRLGGAQIALTNLLALAIQLHPVPSDAGVVRGALRLPAAVAGQEPVLNPYPGRASSLRRTHGHPRGSAADAVIYVEGLAPSAEASLPHPSPNPTMEQRNQAFVPRVLAIPVGTTVAFPNRDPIFHNVFSVSPVKRFDLGRYGKGKAQRVTFQKPGLLHVYCDLHSEMEAFILVLSSRAFVQPDPSGRYALPDLPAGGYVLHVWHPDLPPIRREIQIPSRGDLVLDLTF